MKVQNIQCATISNLNFSGRKNSNSPEFSSAHSHISAGSSAVQNGLKTAGAWFAFGVGLDYAGRKFTIFKSPFKNSLFINLIIAAVAGGYTFFKNK